MGPHGIRTKLPSAERSRVQYSSSEQTLVPGTYDLLRRLNMAFRRSRCCACGVLLTALVGASSGLAAAENGTETGLPIPRFVSMRSEKANVRRGPTLDHQIDWVFERPRLPVVVVGEFGHWRLIRDYDGDGGWVHRALISGKSTALVVGGVAEIRSSPSEDSQVIARAQEGLIVDIADCSAEWCRISWGDVSGWLDRLALWGATGSQVEK